MDSELKAELSNNQLGHREEELRNLGIKTFRDMARFGNEALRTVLFFTRAEILHFDSLRDVCIDRIHAENRQQRQPCAPTALAHTRYPELMRGYAPRYQPYNPKAGAHPCYPEPMRGYAPTAGAHPCYPESMRGYAPTAGAHPCYPEPMRGYASTAGAHLCYPESMRGHAPTAGAHLCYPEPMRECVPRIMTETSTSSRAHPSSHELDPFHPEFNPSVGPKYDLPHAYEELKSVGFEESSTIKGDPIPEEMREVHKMQESYSMCTTGHTKGIGLIIMNNKFEGHGVEEEGKILRSLFIKMGLEIKLLTKRTPEEILFEAQQIANEYHSGYSLLVVGICTHCEDGDMLYASYGVYSLNNDLMPIFKPANCPSLRGKPKIFLINSCHPVQEDKEVLSDDVVAHGTTDESDFLVVHSTIMRGKGFTNFDCCFIAILEKTFEENRNKDLVETISHAHKQCKPVEAEGVGSTKYAQKCRLNSTLTKLVFIAK